MQKILFTAFVGKFKSAYYEFKKEKEEEKSSIKYMLD
jgi:hypothetical protein